MIVVTGAAGFIGSVLVGALNAVGYSDIILVDDFSDEHKEKNLENKLYAELIDYREFPSWLDTHSSGVSFIFHIGACADTTVLDKAVFDRQNLNYTKELWVRCSRYAIPLVYASSAATYGAGEQGYDDSEKDLPKLKPLNPYGESKNDFDLWALTQSAHPSVWAGLKFFNVYGPNEYHKGRMASVVLGAFRQIQNGGSVKLFRSHHPEYADGEQKRDFIYVKDIARVCLFFLTENPPSGIYNVGTGEARTFIDLVRAVFTAFNLPEHIEFIDTPIDIREKYQYFTEAKMEKLRAAGYTEKFTLLEDGVGEYVSDYLKTESYL